MKEIDLKPYLKVILPKHIYGVCAIYEPHPFRNGVIKEAVEQSGHKMKGNTGIDDTAWCWVYYDWCGNPVGLSDSFPEGELVDKFTAENIGSQSLADYLNKENEEFVKAGTGEQIMTKEQYEKYKAIEAELAEIQEFLWWCGKKYRKNLGGRFSAGVKVKNKKRKICVVRRWRGAVEDKVYSLPQELQDKIIDIIEQYVEKREKEMESI